MFDSAKKIKNIILISLLTLISLVICFQNFSKNTYLSGWDTLQSEFDFGIAFKRAFSPAFQDHQGLGAVSAQSHLGDLPRITFLYLLSFIFSENFLRYSYVFLMLIIGPLGVYYFLKDLFTKDFNDENEEAMLFPSFIGALFYLTNLSVVQHFNIPLEMFVTLFGFLGFIFLYSRRFIHNPTKKNLRNLIIVSFLISPSSHTATLFYMFLLILGVYLLFEFLTTENHKMPFKNLVLTFGLVLGTNLFWILPNIYFVLTHGQEVSNSKIHSLFSDQAYLSNLSFGNIYDIALLKNYLFIWQIWNTEKFVPLLGAWIGNLVTGTDLFGYLNFFLAVLGIGLAVVRKEKKLYGAVIIFFLSSLFISSSNSIVGNLFDFLRDNVPFMKEALRFPFNKFSTMFSFVFAIFLSYFFYVLFSIVKSEALKISSVIIFLALSIVFFLPAFRGELINPLMRIKFNKEYFEVFDYFKNQNEFGRVADLPIHSVYGWSYYGFGYQGAGFLWFGIDKPLMNREFDRWNVKNEDYFNEMSSAIYNNNPQNLENILNKYQIKWVLLDKDVFAPNEDLEILHFDQIQKTFEKVNKLNLDKKIGENIFIYKYSPSRPFVIAETLDSANYLSNESYRENVDLAFQNLGNYYSDFSKEVSFGLKTPVETLYPSNISADNENFYLKNIRNLKTSEKLFNTSLQDGKIEIANLEQKNTFNLSAPVDLIKINESILDINQTKQIGLEPESQAITYKLVNNFKTTDFDNFVSIGSCGIESFGARYSLEKKDGSYSLNSINIVSCLNFDLRDFFKNQKFDSYVMKFKVLNQNSNSYYCVLQNEGKECNKIKLLGSNEFLLDKNDTNLIFFNEPVTNLEASSTFSNLELLTYTKTEVLKIKLNPELFENKDVAVIKKDLNLSGNLSKFGYNPRICQTKDLLTTKIGVYESSEFNICDNYNIDYDPKSYHLVEITSKNNKGLPLRVCLQNSDTGRCDLFMPLPKNKEFKSDFIILPPFSGPHNLAITNQVVEGNTSSNEISYLSVKKIDYQGLFNLKPENTSKVYVYYKAFDRGFLALCGLQICPFKHVLVNNWANGWVLPEGSPSNPGILIVFWPNFLSILGILMFFIVFFACRDHVYKQSKPIVIDKF